ncbi:hypothetical protein, partial [Lonsdalea populi]|uniref:hypothetical protein n=1 Tax=Lonsdalea populi TaxID=1172565 RepID=UPI001C659F75
NFPAGFLSKLFSKFLLIPQSVLKEFLMESCTAVIRGNRVQLHKAPYIGVFCYLTTELLGY